MVRVVWEADDPDETGSGDKDLVEELRGGKT